MQSKLLGIKAAADITQRVEKILAGLGNPEPPVDLRLVRELLKLDLKHYTSDDEGALDEIVSRLKVAGKQVIQRPALLHEAIKNFSLKALYLPDQKRILIDTKEPKLKLRWNEAHEIGHSALPWHKDFMFGDNRTTLSKDCHDGLEMEANYAAGQLLFLGSRFNREVSDYSINFKVIRQLAIDYGNTITATLWRVVEEAPEGMPVVATIGRHPMVLGSGNLPVKHIIHSRAFDAQFKNIEASDIFRFMRGYCSHQLGGVIGDAEIMLKDVNDDEHVFQFETFYNTHDALTIGVYLRPHAKVYA